MGQVAIFARVSTADKQDYERQISDLTRIIKINGYKDSEIELFAEKVSGYKKSEDRPEMTKLLNTISANSTYFDCVYVTEVSRLGRNPRTTKEIIEKISDSQVQISIQNPPIKTLNDDGSRNNFAQIMLSIAIEFSDMEAKQTKIRMKSGKLEKITKNGIVPTSNLAYGYKNVDKILTIDEEEAEVVKMIYDMALSGNGSYVIAQKLNQMDIPTRIHKTHKDKGIKMRNTQIKMDASTIVWNDMTVRQILKNPIYVGKGLYQGVTYNTPKIIDEEVQNECKKTISNRSTKTDILYTYLLKNLIYCGVCGTKYIGVYQPNEKGSKIYRCLCNKVRNVCENSNINLSLAESVFYNIFLSTDLTSYIENPNDLKNNLVSDLDNISTEIISFKNDLSIKENEQNRLLELYVGNKGNFPIEKLNQMGDKIKIEIDSIKEKIRIKKKHELEIKQALLNYNENYNSFDVIKNAKDNRTELRNIFRQMISKIIINKVDDTFSLLTYFIKINGIELITPIKIVINNKLARKHLYTKIRTYKYFEIKSIDKEPFFQNHILKNKSAVMNGINFCIEQANFNEENINGLLNYKWIIIDEENHIYLNPELDK
ncbi:recombinase family protein [Flavobacterium terrigena]|uniref:Site-specific DNA recombinase n=1 Tax=Flavobacterium terrigena TaxID=402734 RepID=A0A1H6V0Y8_9FLAO|nr:recombinase family protein [Flavobacterium terrigena]SEI93935.1 Site-specific DNA recombinase [Flavobacterium terrigena]